MIADEIVSRRAILELGAGVRDTATHAGSMEEVAQRIVRLLYTRLCHPGTEQSLFALVRLFKTHAYHQLPPSYQVFARSIAQQPIAADTRCLTLLATAGDVRAWNSPSTSLGHLAIPLLSEEMLAQAPMLAQLFLQFGLQPGEVVAPKTALLLPAQTDTYNIFHVAQATQSPYIPAQETFVEPYHIASVIGFGGPLTGGEMFAAILFSKGSVSAETASLFSSIALSAKIALLSLPKAPVFSQASPPETSGP